MRVKLNLYILFVSIVLLTCSGVFATAYVVGFDQEELDKITQGHYVDGVLEYEKDVISLLDKKQAQALDSIAEAITDEASFKTVYEGDSLNAVPLTLDTQDIKTDSVEIKDFAFDKSGEGYQLLGDDSHLKVAAYSDDNDLLTQHSYAEPDVISPEVKKPFRNSDLVGDVTQPKIAIVIDDLGVSEKYTKQVLELSYPMTLAFMPVDGAKVLAEEAHDQGYEIIIHMPMEPIGDKFELTGIYLKEGQTEDEVKKMLNQAFVSFDHYVGMNNHMGSKLTQNEDAMRTVMSILKDKGLYFLDSRTIHNSVAGDISHAAGIPTVTRDVFLDNGKTKEEVLVQLNYTEKVALKYGVAVAIGHGHSYTIAALKEWFPTVKDKNIELVTLSSLLKEPAKIVNE
jgi:hypothetical protein